MRILIVCNKSPFPTVDGGTLALAAMLESFHRLQYEVLALVYDTPKHPFTIEAVPAHLRSFIEWHPVPVNNTKFLHAAAWHWATGTSYILKRFHTPVVEAYLESLLVDHVFDLIHLDSLFALPYVSLIRAHTGAPIVYRAHNVEYKIWELVQRETSTLKRLYLQREIRRLKAAEQHLIATVDGIMAISLQDEAWFREHFAGIPTTCIPFALDLPDEARLSTPNEDVFHLGAMDWLPNQEAIRWLLEAVWPKVVATHDLARLHLAGRHMPGELLQMHTKGITIQGAVDNALTFQLAHGILVVPLLAGSGLRIKIIEGMAAGRAIVTTSQGLLGIPATPGQEVWVADTPDEMADALVWLMQDETKRKALGKAARAFAEAHYSLDAIGKQLAAFYLQMVSA